MLYKNHTYDEQKKQSNILIDSSLDQNRVDFLYLINQVFCKKLEFFPKHIITAQDYQKNYIIEL